MTQMDGQMSLFGACWLYEEDTGSMMCKCPKCEGRMIIGIYSYWNPYHYCPYCGEKLQQGKIWSAGQQIYDWSDEACRIGYEHRPW